MSVSQTLGAVLLTLVLVMSGAYGQTKSPNSGDGLHLEVLISWGAANAQTGGFPSTGIIFLSDHMIVSNEYSSDEGDDEVRGCMLKV